MNQKAEQLQRYSADKVNFLFQALFVDLLSSQPNNVVRFPRNPHKIDWSLNWLDTKGRQLQKAQLKAKAQSSSSDDEVVVLPKRPPAARVQRASISAEAFGSFNKREAFVPRVIEKTEEQKKRIADRLLKTFMFESLEQSEKDIVINAMEEKHFDTEHWVIKQGEEGDNLYVVDSGELNCYKVLPNQQEQTFLKVYYPGESFGELALLYNAKRAASIQAKTPCVLFALDRATFTNIVKDSAMRKREKYQNVLKGIDLLSVMDPYERQHVADGIKSHHYKSGDYIIKEGERGDIFYMIEEGSLIATKTLNNGEPPVQVYEYKAGDYFGELALIKNVPRQANVIAQTDVKLIFLDRDCFKRLLGPLEEILKRNTEKYELYLKK